MQRKNKVMIAAAIGMVAIVVATTAVRCSIAHTAGQADADPPAASLEQPAEQEGPETEPEAGEGTDEASAVLEELRGSAWTAADGSGKTLAFREGSFVESDGASASMTAFEVEGSGSSGAQRWLDVLLLKDGNAAGGSATIVLDEDDEVSSVACDGFSLSGRYVRTATPGGTDGVLAADFAQMLGSAGDVTMYDLVRGVWEAAILPIGCGMLSFVFTVQLIKVSQRMDGNASMPGVKEVVFMLVFFAVFLFLIQNSFDLMQAVYQVVQLAIDRVTGLFGTGSELDLEAVSITTTDDDVAALVAMLVVALVSWLVVIVAYVVALVVSWARAIQIYVMAAFSPIPLALVSLDETRQMGVGYLKNFAAVCLAGIIILVLLVSFPIVLGGLNAASVGAPVVDSIVGGLSYALQYLAMCVLLILSLVKSGAWARDILGG